MNKTSLLLLAAGAALLATVALYKRKKKLDTGRPKYTPKEVAALIKQVYGWEVKVDKISPLPSYDDQNFLVEIDSGKKYVCKLYNLAANGQTLEILDVQDKALVFLKKRKGLSFVQGVEESLLENTTTPLPLPIEGAESKGEQPASALRVLSYIEGTLVVKAEQTDEVLQAIGRAVGTLDQALQEFKHAKSERPGMEWNLINCEETINKYEKSVVGSERRELITHFKSYYTTEIRPLLKSLRFGVIHGDLNDYNILVDPKRPTNVVGIIDFGDIVNTHLVNDLAICLGYMMLDKKEPLKAAIQIVSGYQEVFPLEQPELNVLFPLALMRICVSVCCSAYNYAREPDNEYLLVTSKPGWSLLEGIKSTYGDIHSAHKEFNRLLAVSKKREEERESPLD